MFSVLSDGAAGGRPLSFAAPAAWGRVARFRIAALMSRVARSRNARREMKR